MGKEGAKWIFEDGKTANETENKIGWAMFHCSSCGHREYIRDGQHGFHVPIGLVLEDDKVTPLPWKKCIECGIRMTNCDNWMDIHE